jgi:GTPase KRas protein
MLTCHNAQRSMRRYEISGFGTSCPFIRLWSGRLFLTTHSSEGQGFILVYSIASRATFERLDVFRQSMLRVKRQKPIFMLVGNKADKQLEREVTREEGMQLAKEFGCEFLETSAKTALNVERLFTNLVRNLRSTKLAEQGATVQTRKEPKKPRCIIM